MAGAELRARDAVLCAVLPPSACGRFPGVPPEGLPAFWERFHASAPLGLRGTVVLAVWMCVVAPPFVGRGWRSFTALDASGQDAVLVALASSRVFVVRQCVAVLKLCACFAAFGEPRVRALYAGAT